MRNNIAPKWYLAISGNILVCYKLLEGDVA